MNAEQFNEGRYDCEGKTILLQYEWSDEIDLMQVL